MFILTLILFILLYFIFFAIIIFAFKSKVSKTYKETHKSERFYGDHLGPDKAVIFDTAEYAVYVRINMVENAKETLDVSYYSMDKGQSTEFFLGLLLDAANRGVKVRLILDGIANGIKGKQNDIVYALFHHPNVVFKLYEPINLFLPWTINNRLHDKYIIADKKIAILGGRNIGDRFWGPIGFEGELTYDRDLLIYTTAEQSNESVIPSLSSYFEEVFHARFAKLPITSLSQKQVHIAQEKILALKKVTDTVRKQYPKYFVQDIDWEQFTLPTNKITLIHNPITRFSKEPWILYEIVQLMHKAKKSVFIQSPYIVPPQKMDDATLPQNINAHVKVDILTNSKGTTPNFPAFSAYLRHRKAMLKLGFNIYEYNGPNSIHSKSYMFDDHLTLVGSFNLDGRSSYLSTETMLVIDSPQVAEEFNTLKSGYLEKSLLVGPDGNYITTNRALVPRAYSKGKDILLKVVGALTRFIEFLL